MKVAITGTYSSGKTTLAHACELDTGIPFVRGDTIRQIVQKNFPNKRYEDLTKEEFWLLEKLGLEARIVAEEEKNEFIADGCTINSVAYAITECGEEVRTKPEFNEFERTAMSNARKYTHLIYLPPEIPFDNDGLRPRSEEFRQEINQGIVKLLQDFPFFTVTGSVERRVEQVREILGLPLDSVWSKYIAFEGLPRAGKTTQINLLRTYAQKTGQNIHFCKRQKNELAEEIKRLRNSNPYGNARVVAEMYCELQLQEFRENHVDERISEGQMVVTDRQKFSTLALCKSLGVQLAELYRLAYHIPLPGKIIYLRVPPPVAVDRAVATGKEYSLTKDLEYVTAVCNQFDSLGRAHRFTFVDGEKPVQEVHQAIVKSIFEDKYD